MKYFEGFIVGVVMTLFFLVIFQRAPVNIENKYKKEAVANGVARFEVDTNGIVFFRWNTRTNF